MHYRNRANFGDTWILGHRDNLGDLGIFGKPRKFVNICNLDLMEFLVISAISTISSILAIGATLATSEVLATAAILVI